MESQIVTNSCILLVNYCFKLSLYTIFQLICKNFVTNNCISLKKSLQLELNSQISDANRSKTIFVQCYHWFLSFGDFRKFFGYFVIFPENTLSPLHWSPGLVTSQIACAHWLRGSSFTYSLVGRVYSALYTAFLEGNSCHL